MRDLTIDFWTNDHAVVIVDINHGVDTGRILCFLAEYKRIKDLLKDICSSLDVVENGKRLKNYTGRLTYEGSGDTEDIHLNIYNRVISLSDFETIGAPNIRSLYNISNRAISCMRRLNDRLYPRE